MVSGHIFEPLAHLELLFVYDGRWYNFILLLVTWMLLLFQTVFLCVSILSSGSLCCAQRQCPSLYTLKSERLGGTGNKNAPAKAVDAGFTPELKGFHVPLGN